MEMCTSSPHVLGCRINKYITWGEQMMFMVNSISFSRSLWSSRPRNTTYQMHIIYERRGALNAEAVRACERRRARIHRELLGPRRRRLNFWCAASTTANLSDQEIALAWIIYATLRLQGMRADNFHGENMQMFELEKRRRRHQGLLWKKLYVLYSVREHLLSR